MIVIFFSRPLRREIWRSPRRQGFWSVISGAICSITASGRAGLELVELGDTNARYRMIDDLHMVVKNRGSLVYAALAGSRSAAEDLILSAIADQ